MKTIRALQVAWLGLAIFAARPVSAQQPSAAGIASAQQPSAPDDFRQLYEISVRSSRSSAATYQMRGEAEGQVYCTAVVVLREGGGTQTTSDRGCNGGLRGGQIPNGLIPLNAWVWVARFVFELGTESRVTEVAPRTIATLAARCFDVVDIDLRGSLCLEPVSGVILELDVQRGQTKGKLEAFRVSASSLPPAKREGALPALLELVERGQSSTYVSEIQLPSGGVLTTALSGARRFPGLEGYDLATGPTTGESIEIVDGLQLVQCSVRPGATTECAPAKARRVVRNPTDLLGAIDRQLLGDPDAEATELPTKTIAGREARCFSVRSYLSDDSLGTWDRVSRENATLCLDSATGALLSRESDRARPASIVVTSFSTVVDPARFIPPKP